MNLRLIQLKYDTKICFKFFKINIVFMCFSSNYKRNCKQCLIIVDIIEKIQRRK